MYAHFKYEGKNYSKQFIFKNADQAITLLNTRKC